MSEEENIYRNVFKKITLLESKIKNTINKNKPIDSVDLELLKIIKNKIESVTQIAHLHKGLR